MIIKQAVGIFAVLLGLICTPVEARSKPTYMSSFYLNADKGEHLEMQLRKASPGELSSIRCRSEFKKRGSGEDLWFISFINPWRELCSCLRDEVEEICGRFKAEDLKGYSFLVELSPEARAAVEEVTAEGSWDHVKVTYAKFDLLSDREEHGFLRINVLDGCQAVQGTP